MVYVGGNSLMIMFDEIHEAPYFIENDKNIIIIKYKLSLLKCNCYLYLMPIPYLFHHPLCTAQHWCLNNKTRHFEHIEQMQEAAFSSGNYFLAIPGCNHSISVYVWSISIPNCVAFVLFHHLQFNSVVLLLICDNPEIWIATSLTRSCASHTAPLLDSGADYLQKAVIVMCSKLDTLRA